MVPGDILFWKVGRRSQYGSGWQGWIAYQSDQIIVTRTGSQYVHCGVCSSISPDLYIGANAGGVRILQAHGYAACASTARVLSDDARHRALSWLSAQVGSVYGWGDILNQGLKLLPLSPSISLHSCYDCSDLVTRFLTIGGYVLPADLLMSPQTVTPGMLVDALKEDMIYG